MLGTISAEHVLSLMASCPEEGHGGRGWGGDLGLEKGVECRELQREQILRRDGRPSRKNFSAPQLMMSELPPAAPPPATKEKICAFRGF